MLLEDLLEGTEENTAALEDCEGPEVCAACFHARTKGHQTMPPQNKRRA